MRGSVPAMDWLGGDFTMRHSFVSTLAALCGMTMATPASASWFYTTDEVGIAAELVGSDLVPGIGVNRTYRIWAVMPDNWRIDAVAGNSQLDLRFEAMGGSFYQNGFGGSTSTSIHSNFFALDPDLEWDSYLTIGLLTNTENELSNIGIDFTGFEASGSRIDSSNGSMFVLPTVSQGAAAPFSDACGTAGNGVLIAQLTVVGAGASIEGSVLLQGHDEQGATFQAHINSFTVDPDGVCDALPQILCAADLTSDSQVDVIDLLYLLEHWNDGSCEDITRDLRVDINDMLLVLDSWGSCATE